MFKCSWHVGWKYEKHKNTIRLIMRICIFWTIYLYIVYAQLLSCSVLLSLLISFSVKYAAVQLLCCCFLKCYYSAIYFYIQRKDNLPFISLCSDQIVHLFAHRNSRVYHITVAKLQMYFKLFINKHRRTPH